MAYVETYQAHTNPYLKGKGSKVVGVLAYNGVPKRVPPTWLVPSLFQPSLAFRVFLPKVILHVRTPYSQYTAHATSTGWRLDIYLPPYKQPMIYRLCILVDPRISDRY